MCICFPMFLQTWMHVWEYEHNRLMSSIPLIPDTCFSEPFSLNLKVIYGKGLTGQSDPGIFVSVSPTLELQLPIGMSYILFACLFVFQDRVSRVALSILDSLCTSDCL